MLYKLQPARLTFLYRAKARTAPPNTARPPETMFATAAAALEDVAAAVAARVGVEETVVGVRTVVREVVVKLLTGVTMAELEVVVLEVFAGGVYEGPGVRWTVVVPELLVLVADPPARPVMWKGKENWKMVDSSAGVEASSL